MRAGAGTRPIRMPCPIRVDNFAGCLHEDTHFVGQRDLAADMAREQAG